MLEHQEQLVEEIAEAVGSGNVGIWLGPHADISELICTDVLSTNWLAAWVDQSSTLFAEQLERHLKDVPDDAAPHRFVRQVPMRIQDSLGTYFSFVDVCPVFYLCGAESSWGSLSSREKRRDRDEKTDVLEKLDDAILFVSGLKDASETIRFIEDELGGSTERLRVLFTGVSDDLLNEIVERSDKQVFDRRIRFTDLDIPTLLSRSSLLTPSDVSSNSEIRVKDKFVSIADQLKREEPIDQNFELLTSDLVSPPREDEDGAQLIVELLRGTQSPWRALRGDLQWRRYETLVQSVIDKIKVEIKQNSSVIVVNVVSEPGSGTTTFLQEVALKLGCRGYPTLFSREDANDIDYDTLRVFFELLPDEKRSHRPVIFFDSTGISLNSEDQLGHLPSKLARDNQLCVIVRSVHISENGNYDDSFRRQKAISSKHSKFREVWIPEVLRSRLRREDQESLSGWALEKFPGEGARRLLSVARDWETSETKTPFLICLYFVLQGEISLGAEIGKHLFQRADRLIGEASEQTPDQPLSSGDLQDAIRALQSRFNVDDSENLISRKYLTLPPPQKILAIVAALVALARVRVTIPRNTLSRIAGVAAQDIQPILIELERVDLVSVFEGPLRAPTSYYRVREQVGLRHPAYGEVMIDWLKSDDAESHFASHTSELFDDFLDLFRKIDSRFPIEFLQPVLSRLTANNEDVDFADEVAKRFLRLQRVSGSEYHDWIWRGKNPEILLGLFESISEEIVLQKASLLHSRGMTKYKSCLQTMKLDDCRERYRSASRDFELARVRAEQIDNDEQPANILSSHGMLFLGWAKRERDQELGDISIAIDAEQRAWSLFSESIELRPNNPFAAYGLTNLILERCERRLADNGGKRFPSEVNEEIANDIANACELLQTEPSESLRSDWEKMWTRLVDLLDGTQVRRITSDLRESGNELGVAIEALRVLRGTIPQEPTSADEEVRRIEEAMEILDSCPETMKHSLLGDLLRYALFSAHSKRLGDPKYDERYRLVKKLWNTPYLRNPIWLYDFGMLAFQTRDFESGNEAFGRLRQGRRFIDVPMTRSVFWVEDTKDNRRQHAFIRVLQLDASGKGWARLDQPIAFQDPIPFSATEFRAAGRHPKIGGSMACNIRIRPTGFFAAPESRPEGKSK